MPYLQPPSVRPFACNIHSVEYCLRFVFWNHPKGTGDHSAVKASRVSRSFRCWERMVSQQVLKFPSNLVLCLLSFLLIELWLSACVFYDPSISTVGLQLF